MKLSVRSGVCLFALSVLGTQTLYAQESAENKLDQCVTREVSKKVFAGAALGALTGFMSDDKKSSKSVLTGAALGAAAGGIYAWNTANEKCRKKHPDLIPETRLSRLNDFNEVRAKYNYSGAPEVFLGIESVDVPAQVKKDSTLDVSTTYVVLNREGVDQNYKISRRFVILPKEGSKEEPLGLALMDHSDLKEAPGRLKDEGAVRIAKDIPVESGTKVRYEVTLTGPEGVAPVVRSAQFTIL